MRILYDSKNEEYKSPFGCIKENEECIIKIKIPSSCNTEKTFIKFKNEISQNEYEFEMNKIDVVDLYDIFSVSFSLNEKGLYFYYFYIYTEESNFSLFKSGFTDTNIEEGEKWQLTVYDSSFKVSDTFKGKVMYQIFPDRFYRENVIDCSDKLKPYYVHENLSDIPDYLPDENGKILNCDFFGGNFKGIEKKLPYIKSLGVSIIYLNPVFKAYSNHRYDTCDYMQTDPLLGNEEDFIFLCNEAHKLDIKIILDGVFSHTGSNSIYFDKENIFGTGACSNPSSPYRKWYNFKNYPGEYDSWWGIDTLPCVNENDESFTDYIIENENSVISKWIKNGADGFRLDVADELPDEFILKLRNKVKNLKKESYVIGEVWEDASNKISYSVRRKYFSYAELDSVMNYVYKNLIIDFVKNKIDAKSFSEGVLTICENYPEDALHSLMNSLSTHDTPRILTEISDVDNSMTKDEKSVFKLSGNILNDAINRFFTAVFLQYLLPGNTCVYYGDEAGMEGFNDPFNRAFFTWEDINISFLSFFKALGSIKNSHSCFKNGKINFIQTGDILEFERENKNSCVRAVINLKGGYYEKENKNILISHKISAFEDKVFIPEGSFALFKIK